MDAEIKRKWVEALRSGQFQQTKKFLHKDGAYCCLGVLCVVTGTSINAQGTGAGGGDDYLVVHDLLGRGKIHSQEVSRDLWKMNDVDDASFAEIADYIEEHL